MDLIVIKETPRRDMKMLLNHQTTNKQFMGLI